MTEKEFLNVVLQCTGMFSSAISTGAAWEIAAQVFISMKLLEGYGVLGREIKYPDSSRKAVDIAFQANGVNHAVELKVESGNKAGDFAGRSLEKALKEDAEKIASFNSPGSVKWVVVVAYSSESKNKLRQMFSTKELTDIDVEGAFVAGLLKVA